MKPSDQIAKLRPILHDLFRNGLGQENVDSRTVDDILETEVLAVFKLHARLETGKALGIPPSLMGLEIEEDSEEE
jgi:hypothetical protein